MRPAGADSQPDQGGAPQQPRQCPYRAAGAHLSTLLGMPAVWVELPSHRCGTLVRDQLVSGGAASAKEAPDCTCCCCAGHKIFWGALLRCRPSAGPRPERAGTPHRCLGLEPVYRCRSYRRLFEAAFPSSSSTPDINDLAALPGHYS
jgi:hypothetical protein